MSDSYTIQRKLAAIMFTDIAGYTALSAKDSNKASKLLKTQRVILKPIVKKYGGSWMKEIGDGLLLTFDSATSAVECSIAIQKSVKEIKNLNIRIAIHQGEVILENNDVKIDDQFIGKINGLKLELDLKKHMMILIKKLEKKNQNYLNQLKTQLKTLVLLLLLIKYKE